MLLAINAMAQPAVKAEADTKPINAAQPVQLVVTITGNEKYVLDLRTDTLGKWMILDHQSPETRQQNGGFITIERLLITAFDSGLIALPPLRIKGYDSSFETGLAWPVNTLPADSLQEFRPIKEWTPYTSQNYTWLIVAAIGAALFLLLWLWLRKKKKTTSKEVSPADEKAIQTEWEKLGALWQQGSINSEELGNRWMDIFRRKSGIKTSTRETMAAFEIIAACKPILASQQLDELVMYLTLCQAAQFGKLPLDKASGNELIAFGSRWSHHLTPKADT